MANAYSIQDDNRNPALIAHSGTTNAAETRRLTSANTDGALDVHIAGTTVAIGGGGGSNVNIFTGTQQLLGTMQLGSVVVNSITAGDNNIGNVDIVTGTVTRVSNVGTLELGSVTVNAALPAGANNIGDVDIATGTVTLLSTVTTVSNLTNGTTRISVGTVGGAAASGAAASGNPNVVAGTDSGGTVYGILVDTSGNPQVDVVNTPAVNVNTGTINVGTVNASIVSSNGTVVRVGNLGTLELGTVRLDFTPTQQGTPLHTRGTTGAAAWGTIVSAAGAGTRQYVSGVDVVVVSGTVDVAVTNIGIGGSTGAGVLARGQFVPSAGISKNFFPAAQSGTNGTLAFWMGGAGTVDVDVTYWNAS